MTLEEFGKFRNITEKLFNYMNGKINRLNNQCTLSVDMYDYLYGTYGNIRYPNHIVIFIGTIIDSWNPTWYIYMSKDEYIVSCIAWALSHELHHADQLVSMIRYNKDSEYKGQIEGDVERASYDWVANNAEDLFKICGIRIIISKIDSPTLPSNGYYTRADTGEYYCQTIANVILRNIEDYMKIQNFINENKATDIVLVFNDESQIAIKSNGNFIKENIPIFSDMVYFYTGRYDKYQLNTEIKIDKTDNKIIAIIKFNIYDNFVKPMIFLDLK